MMFGAWTQYIKGNPSSTIERFFGLHQIGAKVLARAKIIISGSHLLTRPLAPESVGCHACAIQLPQGKKIYFVVVGNVFGVRTARQLKESFSVRVPFPALAHHNARLLPAPPR